MQDPAHAYKFMCVCNPLEQRDEEDDEEDDSDTSEGNEKPKMQACDKGKTCPCGTAAASLPSHPYTMTRAGLARGRVAGDMMDLRNPDAFGMYTFNDHMPYGALEVVQNMMLDFDEAYRAKQWGEVWAVVEGVAIFMLVGGGDMMCMADDGDTIERTAEQIVRMTLTALVALSGTGPSADQPETKNLGWVIAQYLEMAKRMQRQGLLEDAYPSKAKAFKFRAGNFELYLRSYAHRQGITVPGVADISTGADLTLPKMNAKDPWGWAKSFLDYRETCVAPVYAVSAKHSPDIDIGGDGLDISTWTSEERKRLAFDKKDPLPKDVVKKLNEGLVLELA